MKSLLIIPLTTLLILAIVAAGLASAGAEVNWADPLCAAVVAAIAGMVGMAPVLIAQPADHASAFPLALGGTVLTTLLALAMGVAVMATHLIPHDSRVGYWLIGGYWVALFVTVGQLRRIILMVPAAKAEK